MITIPLRFITALSTLLLFTYSAYTAYTASGSETQPERKPQPVFRQIIKIGDNRPDYFFTAISGIAVSQEKEIFVTNMREFTISKFNGNGAFISRIGHKGRGPGDFLHLSDIQILNNRLFIFDKFNNRMAITDTQFKKWDYINFKKFTGVDISSCFLRNNPIILDENKFLGVNYNYMPEMGRMFLFDRNQQVFQTFFCDLPADVGEERERRFFRMITHPAVAINHKKKEIFVTFEHPSGEMKFFFYDFNGVLNRQSTYILDSDYEFPVELMDMRPQYPEKVCFVMEATPFKDYYLILIAEHRKKAKKNELEYNDSWYLFVDARGKVHYKVRNKIRFRTATPDGCLAGFTGADDIYEVVIYTIDMPK